MVIVDTLTSMRSQLDSHIVYSTKPGVTTNGVGDQRKLDSIHQGSIRVYKVLIESDLLHPMEYELLSRTIP